MFLVLSRSLDGVRLKSSTFHLELALSIFYKTLFLRFVLKSDVFIDLAVRIVQNPSLLHVTF